MRRRAGFDRAKKPNDVDCCAEGKPSWVDWVEYANLNLCLFAVSPVTFLLTTDLKLLASDPRKVQKEAHKQDPSG